MTLKKGDWVQAKTDCAGQFTKGCNYQLRADQNRDWLTFEQDDGGSTTNGWGAKNFVRVTLTNTARPGDSLEQLAARSQQRAKPNALQTQIGGSHYTDMVIQPIEYILANSIPFPEGNVIKYVSRWRNKGGLKDLEKAAHHIALLIEHEKAKA